MEYPRSARMSLNVASSIVGERVIRQMRRQFDGESIASTRPENLTFASGIVRNCRRYIPAFKYIRICAIRGCDKGDEGVLRGSHIDGSLFMPLGGRRGTNRRPNRHAGTFLRMSLNL